MMDKPVCGRLIPVNGVYAACGNDEWVRSHRFFLDPGFTDCFDHLPHVKAECTRCEGKRKTFREFVKDGFLTEDEFTKKVMADEG